MDGQTDRQTDRQGQILMPPDYRHSGINILFSAIKEKLVESEFWNNFYNILGPLIRPVSRTENSSNDGYQSMLKGKI